MGSKCPVNVFLFFSGDPTFPEWNYNLDIWTVRTLREWREASYFRQKSRRGKYQACLIAKRLVPDVLGMSLWTQRCASLLTLPTIFSENYPETCQQLVWNLLHHVVALYLVFHSSLLVVTVIHIIIDSEEQMAKVRILSWVSCCHLTKSSPGETDGESWFVSLFLLFVCFVWSQK